MSVAKTILKRLFRVYAHIYHQHFDPVIQLQEEAHLNTSFKHFIFFVQVRTLQTVFSLQSYIIPPFPCGKNQPLLKFPSFEREKKLQAVEHSEWQMGRGGCSGQTWAWRDEFWLNKASHLSCIHKTLYVSFSSSLLQEFNLIDRRELAPLQELIEKLTSKDR